MFPVDMYIIKNPDGTWRMLTKEEYEAFNKQKQEQGKKEEDIEDAYDRAMRGVR